MRRLCAMAVACLALLVAHGAVAGSPADDLLEPEMVFKASARRADPKTIEVRFTVAPGYYLYKDRFRLSLDGRPVPKRAVRLPKGQFKQDVTFGRVETFRESVRLLISMPMPADGMPLDLDVTSQGCADAGVCYPPMKQRLRLMADGTVNDRPESLTGSGFTHRLPRSGDLSKSLIR